MSQYILLSLLIILKGTRNKQLNLIQIGKKKKKVQNMSDGSKLCFGRVLDHDPTHAINVPFCSNRYI